MPRRFPQSYRHCTVCSMDRATSVVGARSTGSRGRERPAGQLPKALRMGLARRPLGSARRYQEPSRRSAFLLAAGGRISLRRPQAGPSPSTSNAQRLPRELAPGRSLTADFCSCPHRPLVMPPFRSAARDQGLQWHKCRYALHSLGRSRELVTHHGGRSSQHRLFRLP